MAAAEARAAWQRAANRCLVQEDRKRAPKLACCPSASEQQHGINNGSCVNSENRPISSFMPCSWNPTNSPNIRWWLQLQPNLGIQSDLISEVCKKVKEPAPKHIDCSYSAESTDEPSLSNNNVWQQHDRNYSFSPAQDFSNSGHAGSESKRAFPTALERDEILEALRHSQTRAREAEIAAKKASREKIDVINLLLRQASHLFACNQWLKILQLENIGLKLKNKEDRIANMIPELPWLTPKEKPTPGHEKKDWSTKKGRRQEKGGGLFDVILVAVWLGLAGAGFLLGWTLLPKL